MRRTADEVCCAVRFRRGLKWLAFPLALLLLAACVRRQEAHTLRLAHVLDVGHPVHRAMAHMGNRLEELSGGRMVLVIYPGGQLGGERECVELLQLGSLDMTKVASSVIENFVPAMGVYSLPYLFRDQEHYWQVFNGDVGREILLQGEQHWLRGMCYYDAGFRNFITRDRRVEKPQDLGGLKIRSMKSNIQIQTINALGGHATPMALGELYTAIQQGVVDGADGNPPTMVASRFHEITKFYILDEHSAPPDVLLMSSHTWEKLTEEERSWIETAVEESVDYQRTLWNESSQKALETIEAGGVVVVRPDKRPFEKAVQSLYGQLKGSDLYEWAKRIRETGISSTPGENR